MTITLTREEAQQVLDAFTKLMHEGLYNPAEKAIELLRARLSAPEPEPVAWFEQSESGEWFLAYTFNSKANTKPLYTAPPQRKEWQGLTDEEIRQGNRESWVTIQAWQSAVWWAEKKLKEKNG
jgi:hypothetical protein